MIQAFNACLDSVNWQLTGACLLGLDLMLFSLLAAVWQSAGRRKLFTPRKQRWLKEKD